MVLRVESNERPVLDILQRLQGVSSRSRQTKQGQTWRAKCPAHNDQRASLSVTEKGDATVLLHCYAGCARGAVLHALGLEMRDLYPASRQFGISKRSRIVAEYEYCDEQGVVLYKNVRFDPKDFRLCLPDGTWGIGDTRRVLYRLPQLIEDIALARRVYFTEGEKDADTLVMQGLAATTHVSGADGWRDEFARCFENADVVILPDNDRPGRELARRVANALLLVAHSVRVLMLPGLIGEKEDVTDWFSRGNTVEELERLANETPLWKPQDRIQAPTKQARAAALLHSALAGGPQPAHKILELAKHLGISERTLKSVVARLDIRSVAARGSDGKIIEWSWSLPEANIPSRSGIAA